MPRVFQKRGDGYVLLAGRSTLRPPNLNCPVSSLMFRSGCLTSLCGRERALYMVTACLDLGVSHRASMKRRRFFKIRRTSTRREGVNCVTDFGNGIAETLNLPGVFYLQAVQWLFKENQI